MEVCAQCAKDVGELIAYRSDLESPKQKELPVIHGARSSAPAAHWRIQPNLAGAALVAAIVGMIVIVALFLLRAPVNDQQIRGTESPIAEDPATNRQPDASTPAHGTTSNHPNDHASPHPESLIALTDGGRVVRINDRHELEGFEALPTALQRAIGTALTAGSIRKPQILGDLSGEPALLLGNPVDGVPFSLLSPAATVVLEDRPEFRWRALGGATSYTVSVFDASYKQVARSEMLVTTEWQIPRPLKRGSVYSWQVTALVDGREVTSPVKPAPTVQFKVIESRTVSEVERIKRTYSNSHLAPGVLYAQAGLKADAEREFAALVKANPRSSAARNLLLSIQAWHRR
jgi:hypothetical protein